MKNKDLTQDLLNMNLNEQKSFEPDDYDSIISIKSRLKRNGKGIWSSELGKCARTGLKTLNLKRIACFIIVSALMASCSAPVYQVKFTDNGANNVYRPVTKLLDLKNGDTVEIVNGKKLRPAVVVAKLKGGKRG